MVLRQRPRFLVNSRATTNPLVESMELIEEILPNLYRVELPLPRNPLKAINSYLIRGSGRNLIIDTGMNREECRTALESGLQELEFHLEDTDLFVTHMHADHSGLVSELVARGATPYASRVDGEVISSGIKWDSMLAAAAENGFPQEELEQVVSRHPGHRYRSAGGVDFRFLGEGDTVSAGGYSFRCIETPGHTDGHLCLYEPERKILVSGDHVLEDITPNITNWVGEKNHLQRYLESLDRVYPLEVDLVLPGHRRVFTDFRGRIQELKQHHQVRAEEVLSILDGGTMDGYQVASHMTWDMSYDSFAQFPLAQKWFAMGEALAHIHYLEGQGLVRRQRPNGKLLFSK